MCQLPVGLSEAWQMLKWKEYEWLWRPLSDGRLRQKIRRSARGFVLLDPCLPVLATLLLPCLLLVSAQHAPISRKAPIPRLGASLLLFPSSALTWKIGVVLASHLSVYKQVDPNKTRFALSSYNVSPSSLSLPLYQFREETNLSLSSIIVFRFLQFPLHPFKPPAASGAPTDTHDRIDL